MLERHGAFCPGGCGKRAALESETGRIAAFSRPGFFQIARLTNYQT